MHTQTKASLCTAASPAGCGLQQAAVPMKACTQFAHMVQGLVFGECLELGAGMDKYNSTNVVFFLKDAQADSVMTEPLEHGSI